MKPRLWNPIRLSTSLGAMLLSSLLLASCGSGGGAVAIINAGIGGTGIVFGTITGFGSVWVNGRRFDIDDSEIIVDGEMLTEDDLALGMVVKLDVETQNGEFTGIANRVTYDDEVQGPVAATPTYSADGTQRFFDVFGQSVTIHEISTEFKDTTFATIDANDLVEISGFRTSATEIIATYVELKGTLMLGSEVELRGTINGYSAGPPETFFVDGIEITTDLNTEIEVAGGVLQDGLFVEVEGTVQSLSPITILATEVEDEEEGLGNDVDDVSLQGVVSNFVSLANFEIDGQSVDASGASIEPAGAMIANGVEVEVEGDIVGGILIADELELREGETKLRTFVNFVDPDNSLFEVSYLPRPGTITVRTNGQTLFKDEAGPMPVENLKLADLNATDFVRVEGAEVSGEVIASIVKRVDAEDPELEGIVDSKVDDFSITILGIEYLVDPTPVTGTQFEDYPNSAAFFADLDTGDVVEIEDDAPADGVADNVEIED